MSACLSVSVHYKVGVLLKQANESSWVFFGTGASFHTVLQEAQLPPRDRVMRRVS